MADPAHDATDKLIKQMEKRIDRVYRQAHKEIDAKCDDYFRRFLVKDKLKRDEMRANIITEQEYAAKDSLKDTTDKLMTQSLRAG